MGSLECMCVIISLMNEPQFVFGARSELLTLNFNFGVRAEFFGSGFLFWELEPNFLALNFRIRETEQRF